MSQTHQVPTKHVRVPGDLAEMLSVIAWFEETSQPEILDPILRTEIERRFRECPNGDMKRRALTRIAVLIGDDRD